MSIMGELTYFLRFQIRQLEHRTFLNQANYTCDMLRKYKMEGCKQISTPKSIESKIDVDDTVEKLDPIYI